MASTANSINNTLATTALTGFLQAGQFPALTGDVTTTAGALATTIASNAVTTAKINNAAVTYAKIQNASANTLLGNPTGSGATPSEITLGAGLTFSGTTLVSSGTFLPMPTTVVTGTSQTAATNNGYIANNASLCTITMPSTAAVGDSLEIGGIGAGGWKLAQNASQVINFGNVATTTGTGGSIASTNQYDHIKIKCVIANTGWVVMMAQGNLTVT